MYETRRRNRAAAQGKTGSQETKKLGVSCCGQAKQDESKGLSPLSVANLILGASIAFAVGVRYAFYIHELHENDMWFSNIGVSIYRYYTCFYSVTNMYCFINITYSDAQILKFVSSMNKNWPNEDNNDDDEKYRCDQTIMNGTILIMRSFIC